MEILGFNISKGGVYNVEKRAESLERARLNAKNKLNEDIKRKSKKVIDRISKQTLSRIRVGVQTWQNARRSAESEINPNNTELIRVYKDITIDAHLFALMQTVKLKVLANKFSLYDSAGNVDEDSTALFRKKWFRRVILETVDADFYGFSLVQLGDIISGSFKEAKLVPREYVLQQRKGVKRSLSDTRNLIPYEEGIFKNWTIPIGEERDLGLLDKAAPLVIKKKEVISAWSEAAEVFGMPIRIGKTNINNPDNRANMEDMLENMGSAAWGVFDNEDDIELVDTNKADFSEMYDRFIDRVNSELSKLILLQTGTTDEKSYSGSAKVHENILKDVIESFIVKIEDVANETVIPLCVRHGLLKTGMYLKADNEQKLSVTEMFNIVKELIPNYNIPTEWISEFFDIPIDDAEELNVNQEAQSTLRGSAYGVTALLELQKSVSEGTTDVDSAVRIVVEIYGFEEEVAKKIIGNPKEIAPGAPVIDPNAEPSSVMKSVAKLYEGVFNKDNCC